MFFRNILSIVLIHSIYTLSIPEKAKMNEFIDQFIKSDKFDLIAEKIAIKAANKIKNIEKRRLGPITDNMPFKETTELINPQIRSKFGTIDNNFLKKDLDLQTVKLSYKHFKNNDKKTKTAKFLNKTKERNENYSADDTIEINTTENGIDKLDEAGNSDSDVLDNFDEKRVNIFKDNSEKENTSQENDENEPKLGKILVNATEKLETDENTTENIEKIKSGENTETGKSESENVVDEKSTKEIEKGKTDAKTKTTEKIISDEKTKNTENAESDEISSDNTENPISAEETHKKTNDKRHDKTKSENSDNSNSDETATEKPETNKSFENNSQSKTSAETSNIDNAKDVSPTVNIKQTLKSIENSVHNVESNQNKNSNNTKNNKTIEKNIKIDKGINNNEKTSKKVSNELTKEFTSKEVIEVNLRAQKGGDDNKNHKKIVRREYGKNYTFTYNSAPEYEEYLNELAKAGNDYY